MLSTLDAYNFGLTRAKNAGRKTMEYLSECLNYYLVSFDLFAQSTLHHVSKHNLILSTNQFIDESCKKWEDLTIFSKSSTLFCLYEQSLGYEKKIKDKLRTKPRLLSHRT